jgi:hypothetical protein
VAVGAWRNPSLRRARSLVIALRSSRSFLDENTWYSQPPGLRIARADGAIVYSSGAYFVFAGGRAFAISNLTTLKAIRAADDAKEIMGTVTTAQKSAGIADGVVLGALGPVYVSYLRDLFGFRSMDQLRSDGYAGTAAVPVPDTRGLNIETYSGN